MRYIRARAYVVSIETMIIIYKQCFRAVRTNCLNEKPYIYIFFLLREEIVGIRLYGVYRASKTKHETGFRPALVAILYTYTRVLTESSYLLSF